MSGALWTRAASAASAALLVALAPAAEAGTLERHRPLLRYDGKETLRATAVTDDGSDVVYGRSVRGSDGRRWLQYWLYYIDNPQDRGIVRTGRHEGDWELVQVRLTSAGRADRVTAAQHSWAESCGWREARRRGPAPVVFVANASHASYLAPGDVDRPLGDPTDEANGKGDAVRPRARRITATSPAFMRRTEPWGGARAGWVPGEQSSPLGPAFQGVKWRDPSAFDRGARDCGTGPPPERERAVVAAGAFGVLMAALFLAWRRTRIARR